MVKPAFSCNTIYAQQKSCISCCTRTMSTQQSSLCKALYRPTSQRSVATQYWTLKQCAQQNTSKRNFDHLTDKTFAFVSTQRPWEEHPPCTWLRRHSVLVNTMSTTERLREGLRPSNMKQCCSVHCEGIVWDDQTKNQLVLTHVSVHQAADVRS